MVIIVSEQVKAKRRRRKKCQKNAELKRSDTPSNDSRIEHKGFECINSYQNFPKQKHDQLLND